MPSVCSLCKASNATLFRENKDPIRQLPQEIVIKIRDDYQTEDTVDEDGEAGASNKRARRE